MRPPRRASAWGRHAVGSRAARAQGRLSYPDARLLEASAQPRPAVAHLTLRSASAGCRALVKIAETGHHRRSRVTQGAFEKPESCGDSCLAATVGPSPHVRL